MEVIRKEERGAEILVLAGRLTAGSGVDALRELEPVLLDAPHRSLVVDLSRVDYIDAAGIGELLRLRRKAMAHGANLVLTGLTARVQDVLGVARLKSELETAGDLDEALERTGDAPNRIPTRTAPTAPSPRNSHVERGGASAAYHIPVIVAL